MPNFLAYSRRLVTRLEGLFFISFVLQSATTSTVSSATSSNNNESNEDWIERCRSIGFDPIQLACTTCQLLPTAQSIQSACYECCQSYMDVERITKPFQSAVLVQMKESISKDNELGKFLQEDWEQVVQAKGKIQLRKIIDVSAAAGKGMKFDHPFFHIVGGSFGAPSAEILFFDESLPAETLPSYDVLAQKAKETIELDGMKREDMKDMILTLLP